MKINETHIGKTVYSFYNNQKFKIDTINDGIISLRDDNNNLSTTRSTEVFSAEPWPSPVEFPEPEFEVGKVYNSPQYNVDVLYTADGDYDDLFCGLQIISKDSVGESEYSDNWNICAFDPTTGVTLEEYFANKTGKPEEVEGYRLLNVGDEIKKGDEYFKFDGYWSVVDHDGFIDESHLPHRRKIK